MNYKKCSNIECNNPYKNKEGKLPATSEYFYKHSGCKDGLRPNCKICKLQQDKNYFLLNKDKILLKCKNYRELHKDKIKETQHQCYLNRKDYYIDKNKKYRIENINQVKIRKRSYERNKLKTDIEFRLIFNLRRRLRTVLKGIYKTKTTRELIGCSSLDLRKHLESKFKEGMTWNNYGKWHIDHIIPCSLFNLKDISEQKKCFHYSNLQPLWAEENYKKGNKFLNCVN